MASYQQKQYQLFREIEEKFKRGESPSTIVEPIQDYSQDNQICLTGVVFLSGRLQTLITKKIIEPLRKIDPEQYYYLPDSLHLTIQNVRTINNPPLFSDEDVKKVQNVFKKVIPKHQRFEFELKGLFELPTSLGICAYSDKSIKDLCFDLRDELTKTGVPDNKTYASKEIIFGNVTVSRYTTTPSPEFFKEINRMKDMEIGKLKVKTVSLITTNSVCHPKLTKFIQTFDLKV
ncbi:MAG: hypothetical protein Q7S45_02975 [Candidatus Curtissbacteria bacterium]|nr:hypothetical protein [Candidatus Curtissbacteria bacterium]